MLPVSILCCGFSNFLSIAPESVFYEQQQPIRMEDLWSDSNKNNLLSLLTHALWQVCISFPMSNFTSCVKLVPNACNQGDIGIYNFYEVVYKGRLLLKLCSLAHTIR